MSPSIVLAAVAASFLVSIVSPLAAQQPDIPISRSSPVSFAHVQPGIVVRPGSITCTWTEADSTDLHILARWDIGNDRVVSPVPYVPTPVSPHYPTSTIPLFRDSMVRSAVRLAGDLAVISNYYYTGIAEGYYSTRPPTRFSGRFGGSTTTLVRAGEGSWLVADKVVAGTSHTTPPFGYSIAIGRVAGYDPDHGDIAVIYTRGEPGIELQLGYLPGRSIRVYRRDGTTWTIEYVPTGGESWNVLPIGIGRCIMIDSIHGYYVTDKPGAPIEFELPREGRTSRRCVKLLGPYLAQTSWDSVDTALFRMEILDTLGRQIHTASIRRPYRTNDYALVQSRSDSIITILFGGGSGLRAIVLERDLTLIAADTLLSVTTGRVTAPAGAFRRDTLFAVWEDHRESPTRIYGNFRKLSRMTNQSGDTSSSDTSKGEPEPSPFRRYEIGSTYPFVFPNPARSIITIEAYILDANGAVFDLTNPLGETVLRSHLFEGNSGWKSISMPLDGLPVGIYMARLRHGNITQVQQIIKK